MSNTIEAGSDGFFHPTTEDEIASLVRKARREGRQLRVLGSTHSVWAAIVGDGFRGTRPPEDSIHLVLDRYTKILGSEPDPNDPTKTLVTVQAGLHLGLSPMRPVEARMDPAEGGPTYDPVTKSSWHDSPWESSLNYALFQRKLALPDLGGITHQTVSGFISTGSSGGTCTWSAHDAIVRIRVIDGNGDVVELTEDGPDPDWFRTVGIAMGLAGVISTLTFRCEPTYDIVGTESISEASKSTRLDFYGKGDARRPSLEKFLLETEYSRLMWWPQNRFDRLVVWEAKRQAPSPDFEPKPYKEIAFLPVASQMAASVLFTVLGNLDDLGRASTLFASLRDRGELDDARDTLREALRAILSAPPTDPDFRLAEQREHPVLSAILERVLGERHDPVTLGAAWVGIVELLVTRVDELIAGTLSSALLDPLAVLLRNVVPYFIDDILAIFVTTGDDGEEKTQHFQDHWFLGLPMDNQMDDLLMPTWFTELWIPFTPGDGTVEKAIGAMRRYFDADGTAKGRYDATGPFCVELYAAKPEKRFFLSPAYDRYVFRVDAFWFAMNAGDPVRDYFPRFWDCLAGLEYRLHWGKFLPTPEQLDPSAMTSRYPHWERWKAARAKADPGNVFLTQYWKRQLGL